VTFYYSKATLDHEKAIPDFSTEAHCLARKYMAINERIILTRAEPKSNLNTCLSTYLSICLLSITEHSPKSVTKHLHVLCLNVCPWASTYAGLANRQCI
jgi:hypothetical protein